MNEREGQEQVATAGAAIIFVPRHIPGNEVHLTNVIPRPLPGDCRDEERAFHQEFEQAVVDVVRELRREFPYKQTIRWSIEYGDDKHYSVHILVKPRRSANNH